MAPVATRSIRNTSFRQTPLSWRSAGFFFGRKGLGLDQIIVASLAGSHGAKSDAQMCETPREAGFLGGWSVARRRCLFIRINSRNRFWLRGLRLLEDGAWGRGCSATNLDCLYV